MSKPLTVERLAAALKDVAEDWDYVDIEYPNLEAPPDLRSTSVIATLDGTWNLTKLAEYLNKEME